MGEVVGAGGLSHAIAFLQPEEWDDFREKARLRIQDRYGYLPEFRPELFAEDADANVGRYRHIEHARESLAEKILNSDLTTLVVVGDDQNELFTHVTPPLCVYVGEEVTFGDKSLPNDLVLAKRLVKEAGDNGFDVASFTQLEGYRFSHAHGGVLGSLVPSWTGRVVLVFVDAIHGGAPSPTRCFDFGNYIARTIVEEPNERVAVVGSGGLSHFPASFPWRDYDGPFQFGDVSAEFDQLMVKLLEQGNSAGLKALTNADLLTNGGFENRAWIVAAGAATGRGWQVTYELFLRAMMGMGVGECF